MIAKFFIVGLFIFLLLRAMFILKRAIPFLPGMRKNLDYLLPLIEFLIWILFFVWVAQSIYVSKNYLALISLGVILSVLFVPLLYFSRDYIWGLMLKFQDRIAQGSNIDMDGLKGEIKNMGYFNLRLEDNQGNIFTVPYHKIQSKIIKTQGKNKYLDKVLLTFHRSDKLPLQEIIGQIQKSILNTPWVAPSMKPIVEKVTKEYESYTITIVVYCLGQLYGEKIKAAVEEENEKAI